MVPNNRPDAIIRAQMPPSSRGKPAAPIIIAILIMIFLFFLLLLFMGIIPYEALKGGEKEEKKLDSAVNQAESRAMQNINNTGTVFPNKSEKPAIPDPILSRLDQPFTAEEEQEERQMDK
jgi:hypothetical protein